MTDVTQLPLVSTIAVGLSMAFVCGYIASKLRLPPLAGYIIAGILVGPHTPGLMVDMHTAEQLSEIGIVLLLFGVGLHFSISDFMEVKKIASIGALLRIGIIGGIGLALSHLWGWSTGTGIIFGLSLAVASTVVLLRTFEEQKIMSTISGKISIGWLIVEDVAMILALVMLPAFSMAGASGDSTSITQEIITAIGKIILFALIMVVVGKRLLPWLLTAVSRTGSRELFTLAAISMAMGIAFGATMLFGVSLALGAFFAGMMIRESDLNHEVADRILPFQDAFSVLFFVSVGMLFNPSILIDNPLQIFAVVIAIIPIKALVTFLIVLAFKYPLKKAIIVSLGLAQIGEFSFILIALGTSLNLMPADARDFILAGALISIALNPLIVSWGMKWITNNDETRIPEEDKLAHLEPEQEQDPHPTLNIIIGCGRVGTHLIDMMKDKMSDIIVIESNREKVEQLRHDGISAIAGDATNKEVLENGHIADAKNILVTLPDPFDVRRVAELAFEINPNANILVRSHNDTETEYFKSTNVDLSVSGTEEIAKRMVSHLLLSK
jgi:monovalent cation:H+ antiporter-2, CPA2 family